MLIRASLLMMIKRLTKIVSLLVVFFLSSCALFQGSPKSYEDVVRLSIKSGQTVTFLAKESAILNKDQTSCLVTEVLEEVLKVPLALYESSEEVLYLPELRVDVSRCSFEQTIHPTPSQIENQIDLIVGPLLNSVLLYSGHVSCKEEVITEQFLEYVYNSSMEITREMMNPDKLIILEEQELNLAPCEMNE